MNLSRIKYGLLCLLFSTGCFAQSVSEIITLIQQGRFDQAQTALDQLQKDTRQKDSVMFLQGLIAREADQAMGFYQKLIKTCPNSQYTPKAYFRIAQLKYAQGLYQSALQLFLNIRGDQDKKSVLLQESHYWAGLCYLALEQPDSAIVQFGRVITEFPVRDISHLAAKELKILNISTPLLSEENLKSSDFKSHREPESIQSSSETPSNENGTTIPSPLWCTVQVGAFSDQNNALVRKAFFENKGYEVTLQTKSDDNRTLYLVWVGSFNNESNARAFAAMIENKYGTKTTLIFKNL